MSQPGYPHAAEDVLAEREALAERVCRELHRAGLPAYRVEEASIDSTGAEVHVDPGDCAAGGVFVSWETPLAKEAVEAVKPSLAAAVGTSELELSEAQERLARHSGAVSTHMQKAIIGILAAAGIEAVEDTDDMRPITVRVVSR